MKIKKLNKKSVFVVRKNSFPMKVEENFVHNLVLLHIIIKIERVKKEILLKISNNVIASHQKLIQELEIIKNKKGITF